MSTKPSTATKPETKTPAEVKPPKKYRVLIPVANDETGKRFKVGATVTNDDFSPAQIRAWQKRMPPVLVDNDVYVAGLPVNEK